MAVDMAPEKERKKETSIPYQYTIPRTLQIILKPKPEWEVEVQAFRDLHKRNALSMSETLMMKAVRPFLREHHWPPGNSQTVLSVFSEAKLIDKKASMHVRRRPDWKKLSTEELQRRLGVYRKAGDVRLYGVMMELQDRGVKQKL